MFTMIHHNAYMDGQRLEKSPSTGARDIFIVNNLVFKVDYGQGVWNQCKKEIKMLELIEEEDKKYFIPILDHGDNWVCEPKIQFHPTNDNAWVIVEYLKEKYYLADIERHKNWTCDELGNPIIYDFGV